MGREEIEKEWDTEEEKGKHPIDDARDKKRGSGESNNSKKEWAGGGGGGGGGKKGGWKSELARTITIL
jgi:hypothetical protein